MPWKSKAQMRKFYAMERAGEISKETLNEWKSETKDPKKLPEKLVKKAFISAFEKTANAGNLPDQAAQMAKYDDQESKASGSEFKANVVMETGQARGRATRTKGVLNEDREMDSRYKNNAQTSRGGKHYGGTIREKF